MLTTDDEMDSDLHNQSDIEHVSDSSFLMGHEWSDSEEGSTLLGKT